MPPRKSTARQSSATPVKKTTRGNPVPDNTSVSRRSLRSGSHPPEQGNGVHGSLPEIQTQQSYAYGSTKAPLLPDQLRAWEKMSIGQIATTIDQQRSEADQRFKKHAVEVETNLTAQPEAHTSRVTRRRTSPSPGRGDSPGSADSDLRKTKRTAEWASSLDSELQNITEEDSELIDDDNTRHDTDPSSFPSGIDDRTYNYERGLRRLRMMDNGDSAVRTLADDLTAISRQFFEDVGIALRKITDNLLAASRRAREVMLYALPYIGIAALGLVTALVVSTLVFGLFCATFRRTFCNSTSLSGLQSTLQNYCGECITSSYPLSKNLSPDHQADVTEVARAITELKRQLLALERKVESRLEAKYSLFSTSVEDLKERQLDLEAHLSKLEKRSESSSGRTPLEHRVNYFAPGSGAIINPIKSSPTMQRPPNVLWRTWELVTRRVNYASNPPAAALEAWADLGDCWCSAGGRDVRLGVKMGYLIYPTDITIEHIPITASPDPGTAPREVEIWASFAHLSAEEFAEKDVWNLAGSTPIASKMGRVRSLVYDARPGSEHVQTFRLDINKGAMMHATDEVIVRVLSNHGADRTCLYRVKLYGHPVVPHPTPIGLEGT